MWPEVLSAGGMSLASLTLQGIAAAILVRFLLPLVPRAVGRAPFWGAAAMLGVTLVGLMAVALTQIALWAVAFRKCGEFTDFEEAFYHSAVNFTTLGYGDIVMSQKWRLLGPLEALNGSLMLGLSAAMIFTVMNRIARARPLLGSARPADRSV